MLYARSDPAPRPATREADSAPVLPDTVLVFRDQHKQEVRNYAIVGQTLWNFAPRRTEKIPLSDLDLPATTKANDERGADLPRSGRGRSPIDSFVSNLHFKPCISNHRHAHSPRPFPFRCIQRCIDPNGISFSPQS